jgi:hypothetical protein
MYGTRWLVVDGDSVVADRMACELRDAGCMVKLIDPEGRQVPQLGPYDAQILVTDVAHDMRFLGERLMLHGGMRWASTMRVNWSELWIEGERTAALGMLAARAVTLLEPDHALRELARSGLPRFNAPFEMLGPVRMLRALCTHDEVFRVTFNTVQEHARVDLAGNLVLGAAFMGRDGTTLSGEAALANIVELSGARADVERRPRPETLSLVAPLDEAIERAISTQLGRRETDESPTLRVSMPTPNPDADHGDDTAPGSLDALVEAARLDAQQAGMTEDDAPTKSEQFSRSGRPSQNAIAIQIPRLEMPRQGDPPAREPLPSLPSRARRAELPRVHAPMELPRWMNDFPGRLRARLRGLRGEPRLPGIPGRVDKLRSRWQQLLVSARERIARLPGVSGELPRWVPVGAVGIVTSVLLVVWTSRILLLWTQPGPESRVDKPAVPAPVAEAPKLQENAPPMAKSRPAKPAARAMAPAPLLGPAPKTWQAARDRSDQLIEQAKQAGDPETARKSLEAALEVDSTNPHVLEQLARQALAAGDVKKAKQYAEHAVDLRPKRATYRVLYGDALAADGQTEAALKQYRIALAKRPRSNEVRARMLRLMSKPST